MASTSLDVVEWLLPSAFYQSSESRVALAGLNDALFHILCAPDAITPTHVPIGISGTVHTVDMYGSQ